MALSTSDSNISPFVVAPTGSWDGDDGSWSTFAVSIGTPGQSFRILPSTRTSEIWIPLYQGCEGILAGITNCGTLRGVNSFQNRPSRGFQTNVSTTWHTLGIYDLVTEQAVLPNDGVTATGLYGLDMITVDSTSANEATLSSQTIAGVTTQDLWLGIVGLGTSSASFSSVQNGSTSSLISAMKSSNMTPSLSYGYTAGASYSTAKVPGSLIIGGYDQDRFTPSDLSFPISSQDNQSLAVSIESIISQTQSGDVVSLTGGSSVDVIIDSTVSELWLPQSTCDLFASTFNLTYDANTELYIVPTAVHQTLLRNNASITFTLGPSSSSSSTTDIVLPYAAFDLQIGIPFYNSSTNYFPIRVANSADQQVLGRTFLQEAYVFVDWEYNNFTVGQAIHQNSTSNITGGNSPFSSSSPSSSSSSPPKSHSSGLAHAAIAGIVVGICAFAFLLSATIIVCVSRFRRRQRRERNPDIVAGQYAQSAVGVHELSDTAERPPELLSTPIHEMHQDQEPKMFELMEQERFEMDGVARYKEKERMDGPVAEVYEMP